MSTHVCASTAPAPDLSAADAGTARLIQQLIAETGTLGEGGLEEALLAMQEWAERLQHEPARAQTTAALDECLASVRKLKVVVDKHAAHQVAAADEPGPKNDDDLVDEDEDIEDGVRAYLFGGAASGSVVELLSEARSLVGQHSDPIRRAQFDAAIVLVRAALDETGLDAGEGRYYSRVEHPQVTGACAGGVTFDGDDDMLVEVRGHSEEGDWSEALAWARSIRDHGLRLRACALLEGIRRRIADLEALRVPA